MTTPWRRRTGPKIVTCLRGKRRSQQSFTCHSLTKPTAEVCFPALHLRTICLSRPCGESAWFPEFPFDFLISWFAFSMKMRIFDCCVSSPQSNMILVSIFIKLSSVLLFFIDAKEIKAKKEEFKTFQLPYNNESINKLLDIARDNIKRNKTILLREIEMAIQRRTPSCCGST